MLLLSNIQKLLAIPAVEYGAIKDTLHKIRDWRDIDVAEGKPLDRAGSVVQQVRGDRDDAEYRRWIKIKIASNVSGGDIVFLNVIGERYFGDNFVGFVRFIYEPAALEVVLKEPVPASFLEAFREVLAAGVRFLQSEYTPMISPPVAEMTQWQKTNYPDAWWDFHSLLVFDTELWVVSRFASHESVWTSTVREGRFSYIDPDALVVTGRRIDEGDDNLFATTKMRRTPDGLWLFGISSFAYQRGIAFYNNLGELQGGIAEETLVDAAIDTTNEKIHAIQPEILIRYPYTPTEPMSWEDWVYLQDFGQNKAIILSGANPITISAQGINKINPDTLGILHTFEDVYEDYNFACGCLDEDGDILVGQDGRGKSLIRLDSTDLTILSETENTPATILKNYDGRIFAAWKGGRVREYRKDLSGFIVRESNSLGLEIKDFVLDGYYIHALTKDGVIHKYDFSPEIGSFAIGEMVADTENWQFKDGDGYAGTDMELKPVRWMVAHHNHPAYGGEGFTVLVSEMSVAKNLFSSTEKLWENSEIRDWLRTTFYNHLSAEFKSNMEPITHSAISFNEETVFLPTSFDLGFFPSAQGLERLDLFGTVPPRVAQVWDAGVLKDWAWWLSTPAASTISPEQALAVIDYGGTTENYLADVNSVGVRVACVVQSDMRMNKV